MPLDGAGMVGQPDGAPLEFALLDLEVAHSAGFTAKARILERRAATPPLRANSHDPHPNRGLMFDALQRRGEVPGGLLRGDVVACRRQYGIVWQVDGAELVLHPVTRPSRHQRVHDVELSLGELIGAGIEMPAAFVRCGAPIRIGAEGQERVGALAGAAACRMTVAVARAYAAAETEERWGAERRHRTEARSARPVRMVG